MEAWDVWLKWRTDHLYNPYWQEENQELLEAMKNGTATEQEMQEYWYKCQLWNEEFTSGKYKDDKEKMDFLFEFQTDEMLASNYYLLDLKEGVDFSFDEIDVKKARTLTQDKKEKIKNNELQEFNRNTRIDEIEYISYFHDQKTDTYFQDSQAGIYSIFEQQIGKATINIPTKIKDKAREQVARDEQQILFMENIKEIKQEKNEAEIISFFHDQKSDEFFEDMQTGRYNITEQQSR